MDVLVGQGSTARETRRRAHFGLFVPLFSVYAAGLILWLGLGLLPTLADSVGPIRHWMVDLALSSSPLAGPASRVLDANQAMPGMSMNATDRSTVLWAYAFSLLNLVMGAILASRRSRQLVPALLAFALLGTAATFNKPSHAVFHIIGEPWPIKTIHFTFHIVSGVAYLWAVLLFPDGRLPRRIHLEGKALVAAVIGVTGAVTVLSWRSSFIDHPLFFVVFFGVAISVAGMASQGLRLADPESTPTELRSARLLIAALLPAFATGLVWFGARTAHWFGVSRAARLEDSLQTVFPAVFAIVPIVLFAGILRYRLWNIDWLLSRGLLYGSLAVAVSLVYVLAVTTAGLLAGGALWTFVVVLSVTAVAIDPLRKVLRSQCNRIVYGQVLSPTDALRSMLSSLDQLSADAELDQLTRTVTQATRAESCELWLVSGGKQICVSAYPEDHQGGPDRLSDSAGPNLDRAFAVPVAFQGQLLGQVVVRLPPGVALGTTEVTLVEDLATHAGVVAHNAILNVDLARHVALLQDQLLDLQASRRRLVAAQDAERLKLERDLHDGAQQSLVAVLIGLRTAAATSSSSTQRSAQIRHAAQLLTDTSNTMDELISDQGPRVLSEQGLISALGAAAELAGRSGQNVKVAGRIDTNLPADVATAVYFCCLEAIQNAVKHSGAQRISVTIDKDDGTVTFEVADDGAGFDPSSASAGAGISNLALRVSAMGGDVIIESAPSAGTTVRGWLPLVAEPEPV